MIPRGSNLLSPQSKETCKITKKLRGFVSSYGGHSGRFQEFEWALPNVFKLMAES